MRYTLHNGFHVCPHVRTYNLDANSYCPESSLFESCAQPIIDEEALDPKIFTLIKSIYAPPHEAKRDGRVYSLGQTHDLRSFSCLDFMLTNLSRPVRNNLAGNCQAVEKSLRTYIVAQMKMEEEDCESNPSLYRTLLDEKRRFLKL